MFLDGEAQVVNGLGEERSYGGRDERLVLVIHRRGCEKAGESFLVQIYLPDRESLIWSESSTEWIYQYLLVSLMPKMFLVDLRQLSSAC